jgi:riboflavin transporter FmnP
MHGRPLGAILLVSAQALQTVLKMEKAPKKRRLIASILDFCVGIFIYGLVVGILLERLEDCRIFLFENDSMAFPVACVLFIIAALSIALYFAICNTFLHGSIPPVA